MPKRIFDRRRFRFYHLLLNADVLSPSVDIESRLADTFLNALFVISLERFGLESSLTTYFEDIIDSNLFQYQITQYKHFNID